MINFVVFVGYQVIQLKLILSDKMLFRSKADSDK